MNFPLLVGDVHLVFDVQLREQHEVVLTAARTLAVTSMQAVRAVLDVCFLIKELVEPCFHFWPPFFSDGGTQPNLRQVAWTSEPRWYGLPSRSVCVGSVRFFALRFILIPLSHCVVAVQLMYSTFPRFHLRTNPNSGLAKIVLGFRS